MAIQVAQHPDATLAQRAAANTYIVAWSGSHAGLVVGMGVGSVAAIAEWGAMYVATHAPGLAYAYPAAATALPVAVTAWGLIDDAVTAYAAATGNPQAQQAAVVAQQIAQVDGSLPFFDGVGGLYACASHQALRTTGSLSDYVGINYYPQSRRATCGIACLRMAQGELGFGVLSEEDFIQRLGALYDEFAGISFADLPQAASSVGLRARTLSNATANNLVVDFNVPGNVIILDIDPGIMYGFRPTSGPGSPFGHAVILTDIQLGPSGIANITIHDPQSGASQIINPQLFTDAWEARFKRYAVVTIP